MAKNEIEYYRSVIKKAFKTLTKMFTTSRMENIDLLVESFVTQKLKEKIDGFMLISEESGINVIGDNPELTFFLDPIDGTGNFMKGIPIYAISLAVSPYEANVINLNSIYYSIVISSLGLTFEAFKDFGVFLNGIKIRKGPQKSVDKDIQDCFMRINHHKDFKLPTSHIRLLGASSIELGLLVTGSFDGFIDFGTLKLTDLAALYLLLKKAGVSFSDISGKSTYIFGHDDIKNKFGLVAANSKMLHQKILNFLGDPK